jgi:hypothetical protein
MSSSFNISVHRNPQRTTGQQRYIAEAVRNCENGVFYPEDGPGLEELQEWLLYRPEDREHPFDRGRLFLLYQEYGVRVEEVVAWMRQAGNEKDDQPTIIFFII